MKSPRKSPRVLGKGPRVVETDDSVTLQGHLSRLLSGPLLDVDIAALNVVRPEPGVVGSPPEPLVVDRLCFEIERRGFVHGIFRVPGAGFKTRALYVALSHLKSTGDEVIFKSEPNVHNVAAALTLYLSRTEPIIPFARYAALFDCVKGDDKHPVEQAAALHQVVSQLPMRKILQRVMKMCFDCAKQSDTNQMTSKNLAIVFTPILFHDEAEPMSQIAWSQGPKMTVLELLVSQYPFVFPQPIEPVYKPPPQPGEVPLLTERDWALLTAKSESVNFAAGEVVLDKGQQIKCIYLIKSGSVRKDVSGVGSRRLIQGDLFGERSLVGRSKSEARFVAEEDSVLLLTSHSHLAAVWETDPRTNMAFWGHVALLYSAELRGQSFQNLSDGKKSSSDRLTRLTMAGLRYSTVLQEEEISMHQQQQQQQQQIVSPQEAIASKPTFSKTDEAVIVERDCLLKKSDGRVFVTALEVRFEGTGRLGLGSKIVSIPYESIERMSTSVSDDVVRGKKHVSKKYSKRGPFHTVTLTVRKRKSKSVKHVERKLSFFCESDALEVFTVACKLFNTATEDRLAERRKFRLPAHQEEPDESASTESNKVVSRAVALFEFSDANMSFKPGDTVLLTTEKRDLRVRGRLEHGDSSNFALLPRDYVEPVVWVSSLRGVPNETDMNSIFSAGSRVEADVDQVIVAEGQVIDALYWIQSGVCRIGKLGCGKLAKGDVFGEVSFLLGGAATCTIVAQTKVVALRVTKQMLQSLFAVRPDLACKFYKLFAAVNLRRVEHNLAVTLMKSQNKMAAFSTSRQNLADQGKRTSVLLNALI